MTYFVQKEGFYAQGIYWICDDLNEAINRANIGAYADSDDYHEWVVYEFIAKVDLDRGKIDHHRMMYKTQQPEDVADRNREESRGRLQTLLNRAQANKGEMSNG